MKRIKLTVTEKQLSWLEVAVRLRAEAAEDEIDAARRHGYAHRYRGHSRDARYWRALQQKLEKLLG